MPFPYTPNTTGISAGIVAVAQLTSFPTSVNGFSTYQIVKQGSLKDSTDLLPFCTVEAMRGTSKHYASGGRVDEKPIFRITSGVPYIDSTQAEIDILTVRDAVVPLFQEHSTLLGALNVYTLVVVESSEKYAYLALQGTTYRVHLFEIQVSQQYQLQNGVID
jgi:hypothetical protein